MPSFSRESDSQIVRGLDIESPRDYHIVGGGAVTSFSKGSAPKYLNLQLASQTFPRIAHGEESGDVLAGALDSVDSVVILSTSVLPHTY